MSQGRKFERSGAVRLSAQGLKTIVVRGLAEEIDPAMLQLNLNEGWSPGESCVQGLHQPSARTGGWKRTGID